MLLCEALSAFLTLWAASSGGGGAHLLAGGSGDLRPGAYQHTGFGGCPLLGSFLGHPQESLVAQTHPQAQGGG